MAAESVWKLGGLTWKELGKRVWREFNEDEILDRSAALSYYFLGAIFPLMFVLFAILGWMATPGTEVRQSILHYAALVLPGSAETLVQQTLDQIMNASGGGKISFGIIASIWSASSGVTAVMSALNVVYDVRESRSFVRVRLISIALTFATSICILVGFALAVFGGGIAEWVGIHLGFSSAFVLGWKIIQWPIIVAAVLFSFAMIYYYGPSIKDQRWEWVTPGSILGLGLWLLVSLGFKAYLSFYNSYSAAYGSLGAVIILLLWFYVTGISLLLGAEINSEIEHAAADHGDPDAKGRGEVAPGRFDPIEGLVKPTDPKLKRKKQREKRPLGR